MVFLGHFCIPILSSTELRCMLLIFLACRLLHDPIRFKEVKLVHRIARIPLQQLLRFLPSLQWKHLRVHSLRNTSAELSTLRTKFLYIRYPTQLYR